MSFMDSGYAHNGFLMEALELFREMQMEENDVKKDPGCGWIEVNGSAGWWSWLGDGSGASGMVVDVMCSIEKVSV